MGATATHEAQDLFEDAGPCGLRELVAVRDHGVPHRGLDAQIEAGGELHGAQDANRIFAEADRGLTDGADGPAAHVFHAAAPVEDLPAIEIVEQRVDGEIAPDRVFVGFAEEVVVPDEEVLVQVFDLGRTLPERGYLDDLAASEEHVGQPETAPDDAAVAEDGANVLGPGARGDVVVLGLAAEE